MRLPICFLMLLVASTPCLAETITAGVAISLRDAMQPVAAAYREETGNDVRLQFGSSGQLLAQVRAGAPIDLFISAGEKQIDDATRDGLVLPDTRRVIAGNALVLVVPPNGNPRVRRFEDLADATVTRIAIGDPKTVPAGEYATQVLAALKLSEALKGRLVYGANVRQVLDYVERGEVSAGVVYRTDALVAGDKVSVVAIADPELHRPVVYPAVVVRASRNPQVARQFLDFLSTDKARKMLAEKGFAGPPPSLK